MIELEQLVQVVAGAEAANKQIDDERKKFHEEITKHKHDIECAKNEHNCTLIAK